MKIRAAVLEQFGAPLVVQEVDLAEPGAGRGARAARRLRRLPHRPLHRQRRRPVGLRADGARARGRGGRGARGGGRRRSSRPATTSSRCSRRSAASASTAVSPRTNLCLAIREQQNKGYLPDGTTRLSRDGEPLRHFMGTSTFAEYTVMPQIALAKIDPEAPLEGAALFACGLSTGLGAALKTADVRARLDVRRVRRGHGRARRGRRLPPGGRRADRLRRPVRGAARARARPGRDRDAGRRRGRRRARSSS